MTFPGNKIGAEKAGVNVDEAGFITVDKQMRTNVANIFAIGDVVPGPKKKAGNPITLIPEGAIVKLRTKGSGGGGGGIAIAAAAELLQAYEIAAGLSTNIYPDNVHPLKK